MNFREPGQLVFPANFERMIASPLDASQLVQTYSALTNAETFKSIVDGNDYSFKGMFTIVVNDEDSYKNGLYILHSLPSTDPSNWLHIPTSVDDRLQTNNKEIVFAINELKASALAFLAEHNTEYEYASAILTEWLKETNTNVDFVSSTLRSDVDFVSAELNSSSAILTDYILNNQQANTIELSNVSSLLTSDVMYVNAELNSSSAILTEWLKETNTNVDFVSAELNYVSSNLDDSIIHLQTITNNKIDTNFTVVTSTVYEVSSYLNLQSNSLSATTTNVATTLDQKIEHYNTSTTTLLNLTADVLNKQIDTLNTHVINISADVDFVSAELNSSSAILDNNMHFTNNEPSTITVGGIEKGTTFNNVPVNQILQDILYKEVFPVIVEPTVSLQILSGLTKATTYIEIGDEVDYTLQTNFNRGSITPVYSNTGKQLLETSNWSGNQFEIAIYETNSDNSIAKITSLMSIPEYTISRNTRSSWFGQKDCYVSVKYLPGEYDNYSSKGNLQTVNTSGITEFSNTISIIFTLPYYATTADISSLHRASSNLNYKTPYVEINLVDEALNDKQAFLIPSIWVGSNYKIQQYDTSSNTWKDLNSGFIIKDVIINWDNKNVKSLDGKLNKSIKGDIPLDITSDYKCFMWGSDITGARKIRIFK